MKITCDCYIPYITEAIQKGWPEVQISPMKPEEMNAESVRDTDILIVRTRTKVDEHLLRDSKIKMVCTATIGFDHIDTIYCDAHAIRWMSCPGCNAQAVCDYVEEAITESDAYLSSLNKPITLGIVGVGHVGSLVAQMAARKGMNILLNDPPKGIGVDLDTIAMQSDIITFHTPLTQEGPFPTYHLCDARFLAKCKSNALIINCARGGVVEEDALVTGNHSFIMDTWENEPTIHHAVLKKALLASMHIAGYSVEGKRNASQRCLDEISKQFNLPKLQIQLQDQKGDSSPGWLSRISDKLKANPDAFETLRKNYIYR